MFGKTSDGNVYIKNGYFFWGGLAYNSTRLVRYDIAAGIVPVSLLSKSHLFFCVQLLKKTIIPEKMCLV